MASFSGTCEIEELNSVKHSKRTFWSNGGMSVGEKNHNLPVLKLGYKDSLEDDINQLFESISIKTSSKSLGPSHQVGTSTSASSSPLRRNALKKPITVGMPHSPSIGASEPVSLKQALRDLCISKASEMAAMKRLSKSTGSPGNSEAGRIKSLYNSVVVESTSGSGVPVDEGKDNMVEISLVPEESKLNSSEKVSQQHQVPKIRSSNQSAHSPRVAGTQCGNGTMPVQSAIVSTPRKVGDQELMSQKDKALASAVPHANIGDKVLEMLEIVPSSTKLVNKAAAPKSGRKGRLHSVPSSSSVNNNRLGKLTRNGSRVAKPLLRNKGSVKKKIKQGSASTASNTYNELNGIVYPDTGELVCQRCHCALKNASVEANVDSLASHSINHSAEVGSSSVNSVVKKSNLSQNNCDRNKAVIEKVKKNPKSREKGEFSQSSSSLGEHSSSTSLSDESNLSGSSCGNRPHMSKDVRWEAIRHVKTQHGVLGLQHFNLLKKLGCGDIGTVYLAELISTNCFFAIKVMDNEFLARRKKMPRAQTEREILRMLDHPFLPTLYAQFTSDNLSCLVMEYCPGGDLHVLRQKQPGRSFPEPAARFYVAEVLLALEYLHMLGVIYRDLKPENILVREDGHIMLTDFDLSLRCSVSPTLLNSSSSSGDPAKISGPCTQSSCIEPLCIEPSCQVPCFSPRFLPTTARNRKLKNDLAAQVRSLPQLVAEPTDARSNSFVGTHEYLAPEIIKGEGHGAAVDWWTFGIFLYELLYGRTPFKGSGNEETLANVVLQSLKFPDSPLVSFQARDLIRGLLVKEPENRLGSEKGAAEIKQHPFFEGLNWALIRCAIPPELPEFYEFGFSDVVSHETQSKYLECKATGEHLEFELF